MALPGPCPPLPPWRHCLLLLVVVVAKKERRLLWNGSLRHPSYDFCGCCRRGCCCCCCRCRCLCHNCWSCLPVIAASSNNVRAGRNGKCEVIAGTGGAREQPRNRRGFRPPPGSTLEALLFRDKQMVSAEEGGVGKISLKDSCQIPSCLGSAPSSLLSHQNLKVAPGGVR